MDLYTHVYLVGILAYDMQHMLFTKKAMEQETKFEQQFQKQKNLS